MIMKSLLNLSALLLSQMHILYNYSSQLDVCVCLIFVYTPYKSCSPVSQYAQLAH